MSNVRHLRKPDDRRRVREMLRAREVRSPGDVLRLEGRYSSWHSNRLAGAQHGTVRDREIDTGTALTDVFYTMLLALDGEASLGGKQETYRLTDSGGNLTSGQGELEAAAWQYFQRDRL